MGADIGMTGAPLTVHMGVQKTASTALHHLLNLNAAALAGRLGVQLPTPGTPMQQMGRAAMRFSLDPTAKTEAALADRIAAVRAGIDALDLPVLISHENLPGAMIGNGGTTTLYPMIERILALLEAGLAPYRPQYAVYTRDMGRWKKSVYNQAVKTDGYRRSYAEFLAETADCGSWAGLEARMAAAVGPDRVRFFALEDEADPARPGQQLLAHAGLPPAALAALAPLSWRPNESLNPGSLEFARRLNALELAPAPRRKVMQLVAQNQALFAAEAGA